VFGRQRGGMLNVVATMGDGGARCSAGGSYIGTVPGLAALFVRPVTSADISLDNYYGIISVLLGVTHTHKLRAAHRVAPHSHYATA